MTITIAGKRRRLHRDGEAGDDVGRVSGNRSLGDALHRRELRAGIVLGDERDQAGDDHADDGADEDAGLR